MRRVRGPAGSSSPAFARRVWSSPCWSTTLGLAIAGRRRPCPGATTTRPRSAGGSDIAFAGGAALSLVAGAVFLTLYPASRRYDAARLTVLWIVLHCFRQGFTPLAALPLAEDSNVSRAFTTFDLPAGVELVVSAGGIVGLLSVALASAPAFLAYASRQSLIATPAARARFTAKLALIPGVVGPLLAVPVFLPTAAPAGPVIPLGLFTWRRCPPPWAPAPSASVTNRRRGWSWPPFAWLSSLP